MENLLYTSQGYTCTVFVDQLAKENQIKRHIGLHYIRSFVTQTGNCATTEPEISCILREN